MMSVLKVSGCTCRSIAKINFAGGIWFLCHYNFGLFIFCTKKCEKLLISCPDYVRMSVIV